MHRIDGEGATSDNKFTEGNPSTGAVATTVTADWCNAVQEEIVNVLLAAGITPAKANNAQLVAAIQSLISGGGIAVTAAGVTIADTGDFFSGGEVEAALQQLAAKVYNGTIAANQVRRSVLQLTGPTHLTQANHAESFLEISHSSPADYTVQPDSTLNLPIGTAIQIAQAGSGVIRYRAGTGVGITHHAGFNGTSGGPNSIAVLVKVAANNWRLGGQLEPIA